MDPRLKHLIMSSRLEGTPMISMKQYQGGAYGYSNYSANPWLDFLNENRDYYASRHPHLTGQQVVKALARIYRGGARKPAKRRSGSKAVKKHTGKKRIRRVTVGSKMHRIKKRKSAKRGKKKLDRKNKIESVVRKVIDILGPLEIRLNMEDINALRNVVAQNPAAVATPAARQALANAAAQALINNAPANNAPSGPAIAPVAAVSAPRSVLDTYARRRNVSPASSSTASPASSSVFDRFSYEPSVMSYIESRRTHPSRSTKRSRSRLSSRFPRIGTTELEEMAANAKLDRLLDSSRDSVYEDYPDVQEEFARRFIEENLPQSNYAPADIDIPVEVLVRESTRGDVPQPPLRQRVLTDEDKAFIADVERYLNPRGMQTFENPLYEQSSMHTFENPLYGLDEPAPRRTPAIRGRRAPSAAKHGRKARQQYKEEREHAEAMAVLDDIINKGIDEALDEEELQQDPLFQGFIREHDEAAREQAELNRIIDEAIARQAAEDAQRNDPLFQALGRTSSENKAIDEDIARQAAEDAQRNDPLFQALGRTTAENEAIDEALDVLEDIDLTEGSGYYRVPYRMDILNEINHGGKRGKKGKRRGGVAMAPMLDHLGNPLRRGIEYVPLPAKRSLQIEIKDAPYEEVYGDPLYQERARRYRDMVLDTRYVDNSRFY